jgi:hypothetical protein
VSMNRMLASLDSARYCMAALILSHNCSSRHAMVASSDPLLSIAWVRLVIVQVMFPGSIRSTTYWANIRWEDEYPVVCLTVILSAQSTACRPSIHISFIGSEHAMSWIVQLQAVCILIELLRQQQHASGLW